MNFELLHTARRRIQYFRLGRVHSLMRRDEEHKLGEESLRVSHAGTVVARPRTRTIETSFLQSPHGWRPAKTCGRPNDLAPLRTQSSGTRQSAFFLVSNLAMLGRASEALDPPTGRRFAWSRCVRKMVDCHRWNCGEACCTVPGVPGDCTSTRQCLEPAPAGFRVCVSLCAW